MSHAPVHICGVVWCCWMVFDVVCNHFWDRWWTPCSHLPVTSGASRRALGFRLGFAQVGEVAAPSCHCRQDLRHEYVASHVRVLGQGLNMAEQNSRAKTVTKEASTWEMHEIYSILFNDSYTSSYMVDHIGRIVRVKNHRIMSSPCDAFNKFQ